MKQEEKDLLIKDLCGRLPHGVKIYLEDFPNATLVGIVNGGIILHCDKYDYTYDTPWNIGYITPYLFPLSSMTEEQKEELIEVIHPKDTAILAEILRKKAKGESVNVYGITYNATDWCNKNHFDYRGLIEKGLAIDATSLNIY